MRKQAILLITVIMFFLASSCNKDDNGDKNKPFIVLLGANPTTWSAGLSPYVDAGAMAWDITENNDTIDITDRLQFNENVNVDVVGEYEATYNVTDEAGNHANEETRLVKVRLTK